MGAGLEKRILLLLLLSACRKMWVSGLTAWFPLWCCCCFCCSLAAESKRAKRHCKARYTYITHESIVGLATRTLVSIILRVCIYIYGPIRWASVYVYICASLDLFIQSSSSSSIRWPRFHAVYLRFSLSLSFLPSYPLPPPPDVAALVVNRRCAFVCFLCMWYYTSAGWWEFIYIDARGLHEKKKKTRVQCCTISG